MHTMIKAVLFDRDGTLIHDVPYNGDPALVRPINGIAQSLAGLRLAGVLLGVVTNQSAIARGMLTLNQVATVNTEVERQLGAFDTWQICPHQDADECSCRKPRPGLIFQAALALHVRPAECLVIGDRSTDIAAAAAAGAVGLLVHTTLLSGVDRMPVTCTTLAPASGEGGRER
jgi:histidinol-phosphate phosphatase family protein